MESAPVIPASPITMKEGIALLEKMSLIEFSVQAAMTGDNGPLTSSPNQRRNMALVMAGVCAELVALAERIDPLADPAPDHKIVAWEARRYLARAAPEVKATKHDA